MNSSGNLILAILAGIVAAAIGALVWMGITVATGLHVGLVAIGIGALVGFAVRLAGKGSTPVFGAVGAVLTFIGCLVGEILTVIQLAASGSQTNFFDVLNRVDFIKLVNGILENASPMTYVIYAIGIFEGYKLSIRK